MSKRLTTLHKRMYDRHMKKLYTPFNYQRKANKNYNFTTVDLLEWLNKKKKMITLIISKDVG